MQDYILDVEEGQDMMVLDVLIFLKEQDLILLFCCFCCEGVCGFDGMNMNGKNGLVCIILLLVLGLGKVVICLLFGLFVVCDLVVDMIQFYIQYEKIKLFLINDSKQLFVCEYLQLLEECVKLDGFYECIFCVCCLIFCLLFWWNLDKFIGLVGLLYVY